VNECVQFGVGPIGERDLLNLSIRASIRGLHGDGDCGDSAKPAGMPRGWNKIVRDSRGSVALFDSCGAHAAKKLFSNC